MPDVASCLISDVLWTLTAPPHGTATCTLRLTPAGWRLRVVGLRVPLEWTYATEADARRRAGAMHRDLLLQGWQRASSSGRVATTA